MTEKMTTLMRERAESVDFPAPDVDAMIRDGDRRLRRHRSLAALGGVAAVGVLVAAVAVLPRDDTAAPQPAGQADATTAPLSWSMGTVIHLGDREVEVGHEVRLYVRTTEGFVVADADGRVWSFADGEATEVGRINAELGDLRLVADDESSLAAWVDSSGGRRAFAVLDQSDGSVARYDEHATDAMALYGIDAGTAYWRDARGAVAVDLATGEARPLGAQVGTRYDITDVESGLIAFTRLDRDGGTVIGSSPEDGVPLDGTEGSDGAFSPDGRWYNSVGDEPAVFDAATGEKVSLDLTQGFATGYEWLDATTLAVLAAERPRMDATAQLVTCTIPAGTCEVVVRDLGTFEEIEDEFALPDGGEG